MKRFGSGETVDDQQAAQLHDRFVSARVEDSQFDNRAYHEAAAEYIGRLPDDQFRGAARNAVTQVPPQQRQDLLGGLLGTLQGGSAGGLGGIASMSDGAGPFIASPAIVGKFLATFKEYPPSQRPSSFSIDQLVEKMQKSFEATNQ